jgi:hypothetical protein
LLALGVAAAAGAVVAAGGLSFALGFPFAPGAVSVCPSVDDVSFAPPAPPPLDPRLAMMGGIIICARQCWQFPMMCEKRLSDG